MWHEVKQENERVKDNNINTFFVSNNTQEKYICNHENPV